MTKELLIEAMPSMPAISPGHEVSEQRWHAGTLRSLDRAQGCLLGQLAGDSLGALVEFQSRTSIARLYPQGLNKLAAGGPWHIVAGQPTDDSEMALALARTLVRHRSFNPDRIFESYVRWFESGPFDVGTTTAMALSAPVHERRGRSTDSQANGSLMRVSPLGIFAAGDPERAAYLAKADSGLTHPHPVCVSACSAFAAAIAVGIGGGSRRAMFSAACEWAGQGIGADTIRSLLAAAAQAPPADFQAQMGWVVIAFQNAFHHLLMDRDLQRSLSDTVAQGGDTDTNGAIVGALVGAAEGRARAPRDWELVITACRPEAASGAPNPRPEEYWPCDYLSLASQLLEAGNLVE